MGPIKVAPPIELVRVNEDHYKFLYDLLKERDDIVNISHKDLPSYEDHVKFIQRDPYKAWYIIYDISCLLSAMVGSVYITHHNELGIFIKKTEQGLGYGHKALKQIMKLHPETTFLANINPRNTKSINLFEKLGFIHIQNTYLFDTKTRKN